MGALMIMHAPEAALWWCIAGAFGRSAELCLGAGVSSIPAIAYSWLSAAHEGSEQVDGEGEQDSGIILRRHLG
jgi:hypothetical protein